MSDHSKHISHHLIEDAVAHACDPRRSHSENITSMTNYLCQFTGSLSREQQIAVELDLTDEIARRNSNNPFNIVD